MMKYLSATALVVVIAFLVLAQIGCAGQPATNANTASTPTPEATPDKAAIETELKRIENDWPRIIKDHDADAVRKMEADDALFVYPDGTLGDKAQDVKDMESGSLSADSWEVMDLKVNILSNDAAVVSGRSVVKGGKYKMPDGKVTDISGEYRWVDTFALRNGQWQVVSGAATPVQKGAGAAATPTPKASPSPGASPAMKATPSPRASPALKAAPVPKTSPAIKAAATPKPKTP